MIDIFEKCRRPMLADKIREAGLYPYFHALESRQDTEVIMEGKRRIMLGSNNYLGLTTCPEVIEAGIHAYEKLGSGCSGSRFLNGTLKLHLELEAELADFLHKDAVVTFSTGFQSNLGIISAVPENCGCLIVTDGVFSMGGDIANLPEICRLAKQYGARVMVDDAHGLGVLGDGGRGTASYYGLEDQVDIYMGTFSKSLASLGGYMAADARVADYVRHNSRPFIFSASIPPANAAAALAALRHLRAHPELVETLQGNALYMRKCLNDRNIRMRPSNGECVPIIPIYTYEEMPTLQIAKELYDAGVYVNSSLPPAAAPHECLLRTSLMATHTHALIDEAVGVIAEVLGRHAL